MPAPPFRVVSVVAESSEHAAFAGLAGLSLLPRGQSWRLRGFLEGVMGGELMER